LEQEADSLQNLDIVFFFLVAVILGWKLFSILGRRTGNERRVDPLAPRHPDNLPRSKAERERQPEDATAKAPQALPEPKAASGESKPAASTPRDRRQIESAIARAPESVRAGLLDIAKADPTFDAVNFIEGAKIAFDMIVQAFAAGNAEALRPMLAGDVLARFTGVIEERKRLGHRQKTSLIGITDTAITAAELAGSEARVKVKFTSEQANVTEDANGQVIEGDPQEVARIVDQWTFARDTGSRDPNWQLVATESPA
jgi:predicted lipid-binding transport protein (Tim44 family)